MPTVSTLSISGSAESITPVGGAISVTMDVLALAGSAETTFISFVVSVDTVALAGVAIALTPAGGPATITMSTIVLAGSAILMGPKRDALGTLDLGYLRGGGHEIEIYGSPLIPTEIWTARVNDATITRGERDIVFDGGSGTAFALIEAKQNVWVGTSAGAKDVGRLRVRSITSGDGGVTGTLSVAQYPWWLADDDYLTFWLDYPIRPLFPYLAIDETFYKDKDVTYSDQNKEPTPIVVAGTHRADFLGSGGSTVFNIDASDSYAMFPPGPSSPKSLIANYALEMLPSAGATPSISASTGIGTITFTTTGQWWGKYTITDDNGKTQVSYRCYIICSTDPSDPDYPLLSFYNFRLNGSFEQGGWVTSFSAHEDATLSDIPDETLMIIWAKTKYDGTERVITLLPEDVTTIMAGYMTRAVADTDLDSGLQRVDFTVETPEAMLQRFNFSVSLESVEDTPDTWYEYEEWLTIGRSIHHLWKHHSTIFEVADVIGLMDNTDPRAYAEFEAGDLYSMADGFASDRGIRAHVVSDKGGRLHLTYDLQLLTDEERAQYKKVMDITTADRRGNIGIDSRIINEYAFVKTSGFSWDRSFRTDESGNRVPDAEPLCASAPGSIPDDEGSSVYVKDRQTFRDQDHCNDIAGRVFAKQNATYPNVPVAFYGNYMGALDIAYPLWYTMSLQAGDTARGIVWTGKKLACRTIAIQYDGDQGTALIQANFEAEEPAITGVPAFCMDVQPDPWGPPIIPEPEEELPDALLTGGSAYYKSALEQSWELRSTDSMMDMVQDPWWRDTTGSDSPDDAIVWYCGVGYIRRSTDGLQTAATDVTPSSDPPNDAGDAPAPTATGVTYSFIEPGWVYNEEYICLATWQNASSEWRSWIAYTDDNGATWSWQTISVSGGGGTPSFGTTEDIGDADLQYMSGAVSQSSQKAVASLTSTKVILQRVNGGANEDYEACVADISGDSITEGSYYTIQADPAPINAKIVGIDSGTFLSAMNHNEISARAGNVSGTAINMGTVQAPAPTFTGTIRDIGVTRLSNTVAVIAATKVGTPITFWVITVSGNSVSFGSAQTYGADSGRYFVALTPLTSTKFAVAYSKNFTPAMYVRIGTVSGSTISFGSEYLVSASTSNTSSDLAITALNATTIVIAWEESTGSLKYKYLKAGTISGTVVTLGSAVAYWASTNGHSTVWNTLDTADSSTFILMHAISGNGNRDYLNIGSVSGDTITLDGSGPYDNGEAQSDSCSVLYLSSGRAIAYKADLGANQGYAYMISDLLPVTDYVRAFGASMGTDTADRVYITGCDGSELLLFDYDVPALTLYASYSLGNATFAEVAAGTWSAYPLVLFGSDDVFYVYGRMEDPDSLGISHIIKSITAGVTFTQIVGNWGTDHCGSFLVEGNQFMYAIRNTGSGSKLYSGPAAEFVLKSTLPFPHEVAPHGMALDYYTGAVYACADTGNSIMVAKAMSPWLTWEDMTYDHGTSSGVRSILLL